MATVVGTLQKADGTALIETIRISPRLSPQALGGVLVASSDVLITPNAGGAWSVTLAAGIYSLQSQSLRPIDFRVPDSVLTYLFSSLVSGGALINPFEGTLSAVVGFSFAQGNLTLLNSSNSTWYALTVGAAPGYQLGLGTSPSDHTSAPVARINAGVCQLADPSGNWHGLVITGSATAPTISIGDSGTPAAWQCRLTATSLQLPNITAGPNSTPSGYHSVFPITSNGGVVIAIGSNVA